MPGGARGVIVEAVIRHPASFHGPTSKIANMPSFNYTDVNERMRLLPLLTGSDKLRPTCK